MGVCMYVKPWYSILDYSFIVDSQRIYLPGALVVYGNVL